MTEAPRPKPVRGQRFLDMVERVGPLDVTVLASCVPPSAPAAAPEPSAEWLKEQLAREYEVTTQAIKDRNKAESECTRLRVQLQAAQATMKAAHDMLNQGTWAPAGLVQRAIDMLTTTGDKS